MTPRDAGTRTEPAPAAAAAAGEPNTPARLLHFTVTQLVRNAWTIWVICFFLGFTWWRHALPAVAFGWLAALVLSFMLRAVWLRPACELQTLAADYPRWRRRFLVGTVVTGLVVAAGPVLTFGELPDTGRMYMTMVLCSWLAGAMAVFGPVARDYAVYATLFIGGIVVAWLGTDSLYVTDIVVMLIVYVLVLSGFARRFASLVAEGMSIRHANDQLVAELRQARDSAEDANRAKTRFLAVASHDLRQPLHALMMLNGLLGRAGSVERAKEVSSQMGRSLRVLDHLFTSLLDFSPLDSVRIEPHAGWHACDDLMNQAISPLLAAAQAKGLVLGQASAAVELHTDPDLLVRIVRNLVDNAIKFTTTGAVRVTAELAADQSCTITVADTGRGIPQNLRQEVFKEYFQVAGERNATGLGLGLAIVRRLAEVLGLRVTVADNPGGGTRFCVHVPASAVRPARKAGPIEPWRASSPAPLAPRTVLCVDDDEDSLQATSALLHAWGLRVINAGSAEQAIALAREHPAVDIVLSDHQLGNGLPGSELIYQLREVLGEIPAALITGDAVAMQAHRAGQIEFPVLAKPVDPAELRRLLEVFQELE